MPSKDPWWRRAWQEAPGLAAVAAVVAAVFWPLVGMRQLLVTGETCVSDMMHAAYPCRLLLGRALAHWDLPLWTDQFFCGYPLLANPATGTFYPPNWLFAVLAGPVAMSLVLLAAFLLAGWFAYLYCRTLGLGRAASALGGMSFGVCGFMVSHAKHVALISSACWLPLQLALVERALRPGRAGVRTVLWLAPITALQVLAGGLQIAYISSLGLLAYALVRLLGRRDLAGRGRLVLLGLLVISLAWALALAAPQLLPSAELAGVSERTHGLDLGSADPVPSPPRDLLTLIWWGAVGRHGDGSYSRNAAQGIYWENYCYPGWPVVLLALAGLPWTLRRRPQASLLLAGAGLGLMLALGERGQLFPLAFRLLPGMGLFRFPQRFLLWTELGVAVLGAMGLGLLLERLPGRWRLVLAAGVLVVLLLDLAHAQSRQNIYYPAADWMRPPSTVAALQADAAGHGPWRAHAVLPHVLYENHIVLGGPEPNLPLLCRDRALLQPCANAIWGVPLASGYAELMPAWSGWLWHAQHRASIVFGLEDAALAQQQLPLLLPPGYLELLGAWNVRYLLSPWLLAGLRFSHIAPESVLIYRNPHHLGRAYLVSGTVPVASDEDFASRALAGSLDFRHFVYAPGARPAPAPFPAIPVAARVGPGLRVRLQARAPAPCWLVLADTYYPGWQATVDGRAARIERVNLGMRGVRLAAGRHQVEFRYRCQALAVGWLAATAAAALWLLAWRRLGRSAGRRALASVQSSTGGR